MVIVCDFSGAESGEAWLSRMLEGIRVLDGTFFQCSAFMELSS